MNFHTKMTINTIKIIQLFSLLRINNETHSIELFKVIHVIISLLINTKYDHFSNVNYLFTQIYFKNSLLLNEEVRQLKSSKDLYLKQTITLYQVFI